jgi:CRP/FNR family transcriptional regulator
MSYSQYLVTATGGRCRDQRYRAAPRLLSKGAAICAPHKPLDTLVILLSETLGADQLASTGHDFVLYCLPGGESSILMAASPMPHGEYNSMGVAEADLDVLILPKSALDDLMAESAELCGLIFRAYATRITDLLGEVNTVAVCQIDLGPVRRVPDIAATVSRVDATQRQIATEPGTERHVVSQPRQEFQRRGRASPSRRIVTLRIKQPLRDLAASDRNAPCDKITLPRISVALEAHLKGAIT